MWNKEKNKICAYMHPFKILFQKLKKIRSENTILQQGNSYIISRFRNKY